MNIIHNIINYDIGRIQQYINILWNHSNPKSMDQLLQFHVLWSPDLEKSTLVFRRISCHSNASLGLFICTGAGDYPKLFTFIGSNRSNIR